MNIRVSVRACIDWGIFRISLGRVGFFEILSVVRIGSNHENLGGLYADKNPYKNPYTLSGWLHIWVSVRAYRDRDIFRAAACSLPVLE